MNNERPVQLPQKLEFLHEKIDFINQKVKQTGLFELKMKFIEFVDTSIQALHKIDNNQTSSKELIKRKYQEYYHSEQNERERNRIQSEKVAIAERMRHLNEKQKALEVESLRIQLENTKILKDNIHKQYREKEIQMRGYTLELEKKIKSIDKQQERVIKLNTAQARQIEIIKQQRNRAEKRQQEWRQKYDNEIGLLQTFNSKKSKYVFRNEEGLRINRTFTNITNDKKGCERIVFCELPLKFHVLKLAYGIKLGAMMSNRNIQYFSQVSLYQKQQMILKINEGHLMLQYIKRKVHLKLQKYKLTSNQIVIMLFGKGDSVSLDQTQ